MRSLVSTVALIASVLAISTGAAVLWANPRRLVNRLSATVSVHIAVWLLVAFLGLGLSNRVSLVCAIAAFFPWHASLVENAIARGHLTRGERWWRAILGWFLVSASCAVLCFTYYFIPVQSTHSHPVYGWGYWAYLGMVLCGYLYVVVRGLVDIRKLQGVRRIELEVWLGGGCAIALSIVASTVAHALTRGAFSILIQPILILLFFAGTAYAITNYRIFDARELLRLVWHRTTLVAISWALAAAVYGLTAWLLPPIVAVGCSIAAVVVTSGSVRRALDRRFGYYLQENAARHAVFEISRKESRVDRLQGEFQSILKGFGHADHALVMSGPDGWLSGCGSQFETENPAVIELRRMGWATPERLERERETAHRVALRDLLAQNELAVAVTAQGPSITVLVGLGRLASRRPVSYPMVRQLQDLSLLFQGPLERAYIASKMQHNEQLATVGMLGASLAHEIRNPLVSLKAFVQLLPNHYQDHEFREKFFRLMVDEVKRIDRLTEQLLDLASPRVYTGQSIRLHSIVHSGLELVAPRAKDGGVRLVSELNANPDDVYCDPSAIKQVLINLCLNAVQVLDGRPERWVKVSTHNGPGVVEMTVADSGPGIAPEMRGKLFQPFQSSKSSGFGLGLAICRDILASLNAKIIVDPPRPSEGATFRVTFPCRP